MLRAFSRARSVPADDKSMCKASESAISHQPRMQPHSETRGTSRAAPGHNVNKHYSFGCR
eukprot:4692865-Prymnesium_polylepis.1